jgi:hypothetical protein
MLICIYQDTTRSEDPVSVRLVGLCIHQLVFLRTDDIATLVGNEVTSSELASAADIPQRPVVLCRGFMHHSVSYASVPEMLSR